MKTLKFNLNEVAPVIEHAEEAVQHFPTFDQKYEAVEGEFTEKKNLCVEAALHLVKDQGVYLISNGMTQKGESPANLGLVAYADGTNPKLHEDWWENSRFLCGGDDFVEHLPLAFFKKAIQNGAEYVELELTDQSIEMSY